MNIVDEVVHFSATKHPDNGAIIEVGSDKRLPANNVFWDLCDIPGQSEEGG